MADSAVVPDSQLRTLLQLSALLRGKTDEVSVARRKTVWAEILEHENYTIAQKVASAGYREHGRATVDQQDHGVVVGGVMRRLVRMMQTFEGREIGQLRQAINQAVAWEVASYARDQSTKRENEVAVEPAAFDPGSLAPEDRPGFDMTGLITAASVGDRLEMVERLKSLDTLPEREVQVLTMRASGHSSKEVATELELSPANVDQIYHRALKHLRAAELAEESNA